MVSQMTVEMPVTRKEHEKRETGDRKQHMKMEDRKMIEWAAEVDFGWDRVDSME